LAHFPSLGSPDSPLKVLYANRTAPRFATRRVLLGLSLPHPTAKANQSSSTEPIFESQEMFHFDCLQCCAD
jgi:hypothetical protein